MKKRCFLAGLALIVGVALALAGCGGGDKKAAGGAAKEAAAEPAVSMTPEEAALAAFKGADANAIVTAFNNLDAATMTKLTKTAASPAGDFAYDLNETGDGVVIKKYNGAASAVIVPETIEDVPVVEIWGEANGNDGQGAFYGNSTVVAVLLPDTIKKIGAYVFWPGNSDAKKFTSKLTSINFPEGLTEIGGFAFGRCPLTAINLPGSLRVLGPAAFSETNVSEVVIPEGVDFIPAWAFIQSKQLHSVTLPSTVKTIGGGAFSGCVGLTDITIPDSVTAVDFLIYNNQKYAKPDKAGDNEAFFGCNSLKLAARSRLKALGYSGEFVDPSLSVSAGSDTSAPSSSSSSVDWRKALDDYEEFVDEYVAFMKQYNANPTDATLLAKYATMSQKAVTAADSVSKIKGELTGNDLSEFTQRYTQIAAKLAGAL